jgi:membrane protein YqaA with SNARE-associated domain
LIKFIGPVLAFLLHLGYFGPLLMGILDSSFLFLPFGNDLLVVTLVARHHQGLPWYVLTAALGSTIGVFVLALVAHKLGEEGIKKMAGEKRFARLHKMINTHGSKAVFLACIAPPPFPFTMVIAAAAALDLSRLRICAVSFSLVPCDSPFLACSRSSMEDTSWKWLTPTCSARSWPDLFCYVSRAADYPSTHGLKMCVLEESHTEEAPLDSEAFRAGLPGCRSEYCQPADRCSARQSI